MLKNFGKKKTTEEPSTEARRSSAEDFANAYIEKTEARQAKRQQRDTERHSHQRREEREATFTIASMAMPDRGFELDGVIMDASRNGLTFRPASNYFEFRTGEHIQVVLEEGVKTGVIRSTRPDGYGIQLFDALSEEDLQRIQEESLDLGDYKAA